MPYLVMEALKHINECLGRNNPKEILKALQNPNANLPFPYLEATNYYSALVREREEGLPSNTTVSGFTCSLNVTAVYKKLNN